MIRVFVIGSDVWKDRDGTKTLHWRCSNPAEAGVMCRRVNDLVAEAAEDALAEDLVLPFPAVPAAHAACDPDEDGLEALDKYLVDLGGEG